MKTLAIDWPDGGAMTIASAPGWDFGTREECGTR